MRLLRRGVVVVATLGLATAAACGGGSSSSEGGGSSSTPAASVPNVDVNAFTADFAAMFRVPGLEEKELLLSDDRGIYFTTPHFRGYPAVLVRIPDLQRLDREELRDVVVDAWLTRAQKRIAKAWLAENAEEA